MLAVPASSLAAAVDGVPNAVQVAPLSVEYSQLPLVLSVAVTAIP